MCSWMPLVISNCRCLKVTNNCKKLTFAEVLAISDWTAFTTVSNSVVIVRVCSLNFEKFWATLSAKCFLPFLIPPSWIFQNYTETPTKIHRWKLWVYLISNSFFHFLDEKRSRKGSLMHEHIWSDNKKSQLFQNINSQMSHMAMMYHHKIPRRIQIPQNYFYFAD